MEIKKVRTIVAACLVGFNFAFISYLLILFIFLYLEKLNFFILVGNISYKSSEQDLRALFEQIGPVTRFRYVH